MIPSVEWAKQLREPEVQQEPLIQIVDVSKVYTTVGGEEIPALEKVSLEVREKEFVAIVGPSGCGKSTFLKIIAGLLPVTTGKVTIEGKLVNGPQQGVGMVFQTPVLLQWRRVLENVMLPIEILDMNSKSYRKEALALLNLVGLQGFENKYPFELSGGMQQRVSICRALICDPPLLLMDEPFGALDALTRDDMNLELLRIWETKKKTAIFVTHSIPEAVFLADRVLVMSARPGRFVADETIELERPRRMDTKFSEKYVDYVRRISRSLRVEPSVPEEQ